MIAPDTSLVVPALVAWHEAHERADAALAGEVVLLGHAGIAGGAAYDGLIALTARHHGCTVLSADRRAAPTYAALGADVRWLDEKATG